VLLCALCCPRLAAADASQAPAPTATAPISTPDEDTAQNTTDPLMPSLWYSLEDEFAPNFEDASGSSNQLNLRAQLPLGRYYKMPAIFSAGHALNLIKFKLPFVTSSPSDAGSEVITGAGDMTVASLALFGSLQERWAAGPAFKFPTASQSDLGSGKWSIGPALGYTYEPGPHWTFGIYTASYFSYAGPKSRPPVQQTQITPTISYALAHGWSVGNSEMQYTYNYNLGAFTNAPLGIRVAKQFKSGSKKLDVGFEGEKNLAHVNGAAAWVMRLQLKWVLPRQ